MALGHRLRSPDSRAARRYTLATMGIVLTWLLLLTGALFSLFSAQESAAILPPLERAANVVTLILLAWAFLTADHERWSRASNVVALIFIAVVIVGYIVTGIQWTTAYTTTDFNLSSHGTAWTFIPVVLSALGFLLTLIYFRIILDAPLKLVFFLILLLGYGATLYQMTQGGIIGNYAGPARLAFLAALGMMPAVIYRMVIRQFQQVMYSRPISPLGQVKTRPDNGDRLEAGQSPLDRQSVLLLKSLGNILESTNPADIPQRVVTTTVEALRADIGAILRLKDANYADVAIAYDKIHNRKLAGIALNLDHQPTLVNAIERQAQRPLFVDRNHEELNDLYTRLDIDQRGPVYLQPLIHNKDLVGILLVGMPYSSRELVPVEAELLKGIGVVSGSLLALSDAAQEARTLAQEQTIHAMIEGVAPEDVEAQTLLAARQEMEASLQLAREQIAQLSRQVMELKLQLDDERTRKAALLEGSLEGLSASQRLIALQEQQQQLREERDRLSRRLHEAEAALMGATASSNDSVVNNMVEALKREKEALLDERERLQQQLDDLRANDRSMLPFDFQSLLKRMTEEKAQLEQERNQLNDKLSGIQNQLKMLGIEDETTGLSQLISQLYEQRATLQSRVDSLKKERDTLKIERALLTDNIERDKEREGRIQTLQTELSHLAADREAMVKKYERLRTERDDISAKLEAVKQHRARLLAQSAGMEIELNEKMEERVRLLTQIQTLSDEKSDLMSAHERLIAENKTVSSERDQLLARAEGDRQRLQEINEAGAVSLKKMIDDLTGEKNDLERQLNEIRASLASTQGELERVRVVNTGSVAPNVPYRMDNPDLLVGLVQELRTPMTSITGYIDLLLAESHGILGQMQRQFLQRVQTNITRLAAMIDDLIHITALDAGKFRLEPETVDVVSLIEDAITSATNQFREKNLTVNLRLDEDLPPLPADKDALSQIIGQLLTNAYLVSPPQTEISISASRRSIMLDSKGDIDCLYIAVEDHGGGIEPEDIPRVFARKYRAENPLIAGLGDTGVGMAIAKALVEAHGGQLWVASQLGTGSTFSFALPLNLMLQTEEG